MNRLKELENLCLKCESHCRSIARGGCAFRNIDNSRCDEYEILENIIKQNIEEKNELRLEKQDLIKWLESKNQFHYKNGKIEDNYILVSEVLNKVRGDK